MVNKESISPGHDSGLDKQAEHEEWLSIY